MQPKLPHHRIPKNMAREQENGLLHLLPYLMDSTIGRFYGLVWTERSS
jgi:hypothetical protein